MNDQPQKYHCVRQLTDESWEYRLKLPIEESHDDDLVSWEDCLKRSDQLLQGHHDWDKRQVAEIERLQKLVLKLQEFVKELRQQLEDVRDM